MVENVRSLLLCIFTLSLSGTSADSIWPKPLNQVQFPGSLGQCEGPHSIFGYVHVLQTISVEDHKQKPQFRHLGDGVVKALVFSADDKQQSPVSRY